MKRQVDDDEITLAMAVDQKLVVVTE